MLKKILKPIGTIVIIAIILYVAFLYFKVERYRAAAAAAADRAAYEEIDRLKISETKRIKEYQDLFRAYFWKQEEIERIHTRYRCELEKLRGRVSEYENKEFRELEDCQKKYNNLFRDYVLSIDLHDDEIKAIVKLKDEQISNVRKSFDLCVENYDSCNERARIMEGIIDRSKKHLFWKKVKYGTVGAVLAAALIFAVK